MTDTPAPPAPPPASSPTGRPVVSPRSIPWVLVIGGAAVAGLELCSHVAPPPWSAVCQAGAVTLAAALGISSPGLRKV